MGCCVFLGMVGAEGEGAIRLDVVMHVAGASEVDCLLGCLSRVRWKVRHNTRAWMVRGAHGNFIAMRLCGW